MLEKMSRWFPESTLIRTENGWCFPKELTKRERFLIWDELTKQVYGVLPKKYDVWNYSGKLIGTGSKLRRNIPIGKESEIKDKLDTFVVTKELLLENYYELIPINYEGKLYRFDITPIHSFDFNLSKNVKYSLY